MRMLLRRVAAATLLLTSLTLTPALAQQLSESEIASLRAEAQNLLVEKMPEAALAKIEQVIIASPTDLAARFFRSQILVSLGRGAEIKDELQLMTTLNISADDKAKARALIEAIEKAERRFEGSLTVKGGFGYGDNVNSWPTGGETTSTAGIDAAMGDPIYKKYKPIHDTFTAGSLTFRGSYSLSADKSLKANFSLSSSMKEASDTISLDNKIQSGSLGLQKDFTSGTTVKIGTSSTTLDRVNEHEGSAVTSDVKYGSYDAEVSQKFLGTYSAGVKVSSKTSRNSKITNAKNSDANTSSASLFIGRPLTKTSYGRITVSQTKARANETVDTAKTKVNKDTNSVSALYVIALPNDQRIVSTLSYAEGKHLKKLIKNKNRLDKTTSATLSYNIKGSSIWSKLSGLDFSIDGTFSETESNQASARIASKTIMFNISKKFDL